MSKAPDPVCPQKVWRKITLVKFKGNEGKSKGNLRKIRGNFRKIRGNLRRFKGNFREQKGSGAFDNKNLEFPGLLSFPDTENSRTFLVCNSLRALVARPC